MKNIFSTAYKLTVTAIVFVIFSPTAEAQLDRDKKWIKVDSAAVATAHPEASRIAVDMLKQGGNAVDAAIAAAYAVGVFEPTGSGIGGGATALLYNQEEDEYHYVDFYPRAPKKPHREFNRDRHMPSVKAINIPGLVAGLEHIRERWAKLDRRTHLQPSIDAARDGFIPDSVLHELITSQTEKMSVYNESRELFTVDGEPIPKDFRITNPDLADVMERVADDGTQGFYSSSLTDSIVAQLQQYGGNFTREDFEEYDVRTSQPVQTTYRDYDIISASPPQSGVLISQTFNMMELFDFSEHGHYTEDAYPLHVMMEIMKRSYGDRLRYLSDPAFVDMPLQGLMSKEFAQHRYRDINHSFASPRHPKDTEPGNPYLFESGATASGIQFGREYDEWDDIDDDGASSYDWWSDDMYDAWGSPHDDEFKMFQDLDTLDHTEKDTLLFEQHWIDGEFDEDEPDGDLTSHINVIDEDGNMVSMTSTIGLFFGSGVVANGIIFNSAQSVFSTTNAVNLVEPQKTGRSTTAPTIVTKDDRPFAMLGAAGGGRIPAAIILGLHNMIDHGYDAYEANAAPRFLARRWHERHEFESRINEDVLRSIRRMGHPISVMKPIEMYFGGMQIIKVNEDGTIEASSDPRRDGSPAGY